MRGQRIVIAGTGPLLLAAAATARKAGAHVLRVAEHTSWRDLTAFAAQLVRWPTKALQATRLLHPGLRANTHVLEALGNTRVEAVRLQRGSMTEELDCDRIACGFGLVPHTHLGQMLGCSLGERGGLQVDALMQTTLPGVYAAGECTGFGGSERALVQGAIAGDAAAGHTEAAQALQGELAQRSGWIDAKLHSRCGMGACQGRICGAAAQVLYGWTPQPARHLLSPARLSTLAAADHDVLPFTESISKA